MSLHWILLPRVWLAPAFLCGALSPSTICVSPLAWWTLLAPLWRLPKTPHSTYPPHRALLVGTSLSMLCNISFKNSQGVSVKFRSPREVQGEMRFVASRARLEGQPPMHHLHMWLSSICPVLSPLPLTRYEPALAWWNPLAPPRWLLETLTHPTGSCSFGSI